MLLVLYHTQGAVLYGINNFTCYDDVRVTKENQSKVRQGVHALHQDVFLQHIL